MGRMQDAMRRAAEQAEAPAREEHTWASGEFPDEPSTDGSPQPAEVSDGPGAALTAEPDPPDPPVEASRQSEAVGDVAPLDTDMMRPPDAPEASSETGEEAAPRLQQRMSRHLKAKVVVDDEIMSSSREQYRRLAAALHHANEASGLRVVMVASAVAGEGKSLTAANLALTFSESYRRSVLLVDGDLRRPSLHKMFGIEAETGLSEALDSPEEPELAVFQISPLLTILPAGRPSANPMAGLTSVRMRRLIDEARSGFDWVFIDTPPVGLLSDANLLSAMVDATVLVIRAGRTPFDLVRRAVDAIGPDRILGTVLNQAVSNHEGYSDEYDYYRYYGTSTTQPVQGG